ncbi:aminopeptidase [candidate division KSB1 bacterium]|nr:MAG: aminopeptidase [candidate division KSB1 bacterium]
MTPLIKSAKTALSTCLGLRQNERLLIVTDPNKQNIGQAFFTAGIEMTEHVILTQIPVAEVNGQEPPQDVADLMSKYDVIVCPTTKSLTHTNARRNACKAGARVATMPNITEDIMTRTLNADYQQIAERTKRIAAILDEGKMAHVTTSLGTDLHMPINGIKAIASTGLLLEKGQGGNLPSGEAFLMPEEGATEGVLVADASVAVIGKLSKPIKITIKEGFAVKMEGGRQADQLFTMLSRFGRDGLNVAELGIGTNHAAKITGVILEDEKVLGTAHVAFGNNVSMGGTYDVGIHVDCVFTKPSIYIDDKPLMLEGNLVVDIH